MATDKIRKYVLPNIPYLFIGWFCLKIGTAYRLAAGAGFGEKLLGLGQTIGAAFASFAPGLAPLDWFVGIVGAVGFRLLIYCKAKKAKKFRRDAEYGTARWGTEKDIKPFVDPKFENNIAYQKCFNPHCIATKKTSATGTRSACRQSCRQCIELHGESAERGWESPFCVQSKLIQECF